MSIMKYFFCCGGGGCGRKLQGKQSLTPDLLCTSTVPSSTLPQFFSGTGVMRHINGLSSNIHVIMEKIISYAPHNNLFHYLSLVSLILKEKLRLSTTLLLRRLWREGCGRSLG